MQRKLMFRVWDKAKRFLLPTSDGLVFTLYDKRKISIANLIMEPRRYLVTVLCLSTDSQKVYGLDVLSVFSKDYKNLKEAGNANANVRIVLVDQDGFVKVDGEKIHVTELGELYNFENNRFALYTEAFATMFRNELAELIAYDAED